MHSGAAGGVPGSGHNFKFQPDGSSRRESCGTRRQSGTVAGARAFANSGSGNSGTHTGHSCADARNSGTGARHFGADNFDSSDGTDESYARNDADKPDAGNNANWSYSGDDY